MSLSQLLSFPDCISASAACPAGQTPFCYTSCKVPLPFIGSCCQPQIHPLQPHTFMCFRCAFPVWGLFPTLDNLFLIEFKEEGKSHWPQFPRETRNLLWKLPLLFARTTLSAPLIFFLPCSIISETNLFFSFLYSPLPPGTAYLPTACGKGPQLHGALSFWAALLSTQVHSEC